MDHVSPTSSDLGQLDCVQNSARVMQNPASRPRPSIGPMLAAKNHTLGKPHSLEASQTRSRTQVALLPAEDWPARPRHACSRSFPWIDSVQEGGTLLGHAQVLGHRRHAQTLLVIFATARLVRERDCVSLQLQGEVHPLCCWLCCCDISTRFVSSKESPRDKVYLV